MEEESPVTEKQIGQHLAGGPGLRIHGDLAVLFGALANAQANYKPLKKTRDNPYYSSKYADLSDVLEACLPALQAEGFCLIQPPVRVGTESWTMYTILGHASGGYFQLEATIPSTDGWQKFGGAVTYCRRYQVSALAGVASEPDDDGNAADGNGKSRSGPARQVSQATPPKVQQKPPPKPAEKAPESPAEAPQSEAKQVAKTEEKPGPHTRDQQAKIGQLVNGRLFITKDGEAVPFTRALTNAFASDKIGKPLLVEVNGKPQANTDVTTVDAERVIAELEKLPAKGAA